MHLIKLSSITTLLLLITISAHGQVSFAIACNQNTYQIEVIVEGREQANQKILKGGFPNQAAAESYRTNNASTLQCGNNRGQSGTNQNPSNRNAPPSRAAPSSNTTATVQPNANDGYYRKKVLLFGAITYAQDLPFFYTAEGAQQAGFNVGLRTYFGKKIKFGLGAQYAGILGAFEPTVLDDISGSEGVSNAIRTEILGLYPIHLGNDNWLNFSVSGVYYLNHKTDLGENIFISPQPISQFYAGAVELGVDIGGLNVGVGLEITGDILEFHSSGIYLLRLNTGISF